MNKLHRAGYKEMETIHKLQLILLGFTPDLVFQIWTNFLYMHVCMQTYKKCCKVSLIFLVLPVEFTMLYKRRVKHDKVFLELRKSLPILTRDT